MALLGVLLAGCSAIGPSTGSGREPSPSTASSREPSAEELAKAKKAAGIPDCPPSDPSVAPVRSGLPDVVLPCLGGGRDVRLAGLRGRPMMINIWAQWCEPCRAEARFLSTVARQPRDELMIIGIDYSDPKPDWAIEFAQLARWTYPQLADQDQVLRAPLQIAGPPQTIFVAPDGRIVHRHSGPFRSTAEITTALDRYLGVG